MKEKLKKLEDDLEMLENKALFSQAVMIPVIVRDLLGLLKIMVKKIEG